MITISLCMIVKNEEKNLKRCLDSVSKLMDEIIIVDTGSTDNTKTIAAMYTDKIYDFEWCDDFSKARNFAFSKATKDYIYAPDADEYIDDTNQKKFEILKQAMLPEIDIVQMYYVSPDKYNTVINFKKELRPKLFKRLREFVWENAIHETVRLDPIIFDSEVEIEHLPHGNHSKRDFGIFEKVYKEDGKLSEKIYKMYAKELYKCGDIEDLKKAKECFLEHYENNADMEAAAVLAKAYRLEKDIPHFFAFCLKAVATEGCAEICYELGQYYFDIEDYKEASLWFYNAAYETSAVLDIFVQGSDTFEKISICYEKQEDMETAAEYKKLARDWQIPEE